MKNRKLGSLECEVCCDSGWVVNDDKKTPINQYGSINNLKDGAELIRCWQCNDVSWSLFRDRQAKTVEEPTG